MHRCSHSRTRGTITRPHSPLFVCTGSDKRICPRAGRSLFPATPAHTCAHVERARIIAWFWVGQQGRINGLRSYVYAEVCVRSASVHMREHTAHIKTYQQVGLAFNGTAFVRVNPRKGVAAPAQTHTPQPADDTRAYISCIPARKMGEDRGNMRTVNEQNHHRDKDFKSREHCIMPPSGCPGARSPGVAKMHCCNLVVRSLNISTGTTNTSSSPGIEVVLASEHECI